MSVVDGSCHTELRTQGCRCLLWLSFLNLNWSSGGVSYDMVSCEFGQSDFQGLMECSNAMGGWLESVIMSSTRLDTVSWLQARADLRQNLRYMIYP